MPRKELLVAQTLGDGKVMAGVLSVARRVLPGPARRWLRGQHQRLARTSVIGRMRFASLRQITPFSRVFGFDRGLPVDRYYIEAFLAQHASDIRGRVLEVGDATYTVKFGGDRVVKSDVLHATSGNPRATIVADLASAEHIPADAFDCIILTQVLQCIYDVRGALRTLSRILKPGGVLLATFPGITQISRYDMDQWGDYWRLTTLAARRLFGEVFPEAHTRIAAHGNVLATIVFLHGLPTHELRQEELDARDPDYEMLITVRATKPEGL